MHADKAALSSNAPMRALTMLRLESGMVTLASVAMRWRWPRSHICACFIQCIQRRGVWPLERPLTLAHALHQHIENRDEKHADQSRDKHPERDRRSKRLPR